MRHNPLKKIGVEGNLSGRDAVPIAVYSCVKKMKSVREGHKVVFKSLMK